MALSWFPVPIKTANGPLYKEDSAEQDCEDEAPVDQFSGTAEEAVSSAKDEGVCTKQRLQDSGHRQRLQRH